jgi:dTDP-4-dehydrorhamnose 3,5-epimerase
LKFIETNFQGCYLIQIEKKVDDRGFFARTWDKKEFMEYGLCSDFVQCNISFNEKRGTIRGLHYQEKPYEEGKLVRCTKGKILEIFIDLRKNSKTYRQWGSVELDSKKEIELFVPKGFALGLQTLEDNTEIFYQMSQFYKPEFSRGIRWNDPYFDIHWSLEPTVISKKDQNINDFLG